MLRAVLVLSALSLCAAGFCAGKAAGLYANPASCTSFYSCFDGVDNILACPPGLYFNSHTLQCDYSANVQCANAPAASPSPASSSGGASSGTSGGSGSGTASLGFGVTCPPPQKFGSGPPARCTLPSDPQNRPAVPLESWLTKAVFYDLFRKANIGWGPNPCSPYSYEAFIYAARYFPRFGSEHFTQDPSGKGFGTRVYTPDQTYRRDVLAFFAHGIQETGENDISLYTSLSQAQADACFYRGGFYNWFEGGPTSGLLPDGGHTPSDGALCNVAGAYCDSSSAFFWPCNPATSGQWLKGCYFGRGAIQLSYNFNYGLFQRWLSSVGINVDIITNPNLLVTKTDPPLAIMASLWFFMTPQPPKPAMHDIVVGNWVPSPKDRATGFYGPVFGPTSLVINDECGGEDPGPVGGPGENRRIRAFKFFCNLFGVPYGDMLSCAGMLLDNPGMVVSYDADWTTTWLPGPCKCAQSQTGGIIAAYDSVYMPQYTSLNAANQLWCEQSLAKGWQPTSGCAGRT